MGEEEKENSMNAGNKIIGQAAENFVFPLINIGREMLPFAAASTSPSPAAKKNQKHRMEMKQPESPLDIGDPWAAQSRSNLSSESLFYSAHSSSSLAANKQAAESGNLFPSAVPFPFSSFLAESESISNHRTGGARGGNVASSNRGTEDFMESSGLKSILLETTTTTNINNQNNRNSAVTYQFNKSPRVPSLIYGEIGGGGRPSESTIGSNGKSAYDKLLPDLGTGFSGLMGGGGGIQRDGKPRDEQLKFQDRSFAVLFTFAFWLMIGLGFYYMASVSPPSEDFSDSLFYAFSKTSKYIGCLLVGSFIIGIAWILILKRFLIPTIWLTIVLIPASFFAYSIWGFYELFHSPAGLESETRGWLIPESLLSLTAGLAGSYLIHTRKRTIASSARLVEISFEILAANPSLFIVCLLILLMYMLFCLLWLAMFVSITFMGHVDGDSHKWIPSPSSGWLAAFFLFMFLWTSSVFHYLERCTISAVVCEWYFHRFDPVKGMWKNDLPVYSFRRASTYSFGSVCFAAVLLSFFQLVRMFLSVLRRAGRFFQADNWIGRVISTVVEGLEALTQGMNSYSIVYISYSGTDFITATKKATELFRRNLISALLTDNLAKFLLLFGVYGVALGCFLATFTFSVQDLHSPYAWAVSSVGMMLSFFLIRFCTLIIVQIMDALYVCYVIDVDTNDCHSEAVHLAFSDTSQIEFDNSAAASDVY